MVVASHARASQYVVSLSTSLVDLVSRQILRYFFGGSIDVQFHETAIINSCYPLCILDLGCKRSARSGRGEIILLRHLRWLYRLRRFGYNVLWILHWRRGRWSFMKPTPFSLLLSFLGPISIVSSAIAQVSSIPISDRYIEGEILFPTGEVASFQSREGALITVKNDAGATNATGMILRLVGDTTKVKVLILKIQAQGGRGDATAKSPPEEISLGSKLVVQQSEPITVSLNKVGQRQFPNPPSDLKNPGVYSTELCCVTFNGKEVCANSVRTPVGDCPK